MSRKYPKQNLVFPVLGLHEGVGYDIQPPGTTADALNVRGYDSLKQRLRGGRRPGQSKWHSAQINGSNPIQLMQKVVQARVPALSAVTPATGFADYAVAASSPDFLGDWYTMFVVQGSVSEPEDRSTTRWEIQTGPPKAIVCDPLGTGTRHVTFLKSGYRTTRDITVQYKAKPTTETGSGVTDLMLHMGVMFRADVVGHSFFEGAWEKVSTDKVKFVVNRWAAGIVTLAVATGPTFDVSGSTTPVDGLTVRVEFVDLETVKITMAWSDSTQQSTDAQWLGTSFEFTDSTNLVGDKYAFGGPSIVSGNPVGVGERRITEITVTFEKPSDPNTLFEIKDSDSPLSLIYQLPEGWSRWDVSATGVVSDESDGPEESNVSFSPSIETSTNFLKGIVSATAAAIRNLIRRTTAPTVHQAIELRFTNDGRNAGSNQMAAVFAVNGDLDRFVVVTFEGSSSGTMATNGFGTITRTSIVVHGSTPNQVLLAQSGYSLGRPHLYMKHGEGHRIRTTFDGSIIRILIEGQEWLNYTLTAADLTNLGYTATTVPKRNAIGFNFGNEARIVEFVEGEQQSIQDQLVVVAGGTIKVLADGVLSTPTGGSGALSTALYRAQAQAAYGRVFFVDGNAMKVYRFSTDAVTAWTATAGTVPSKARLIALYRGRVVTSGVQSDPHNWFMPKHGDPFDFDYSPAVPSVIQAVAGNNSDAGLIGDIVTALIPFGDDYMWIGGDSTIWQLTGDPAAGGTIDQVTDKTGILFGKAWTKSPENELFFAAIDGIYRAVPNQLPKNITKGRLDKRIRDIDTSAYRVFLEWDYLRWGLVVMYMALDGLAANIAYFWDARSDAWWPDEYSATHGPSSMYAFDGLAVGDQAMLFGSRDGYIRKIDDAAADDDGTAITSRVRFAPLIAPNHDAEVVTGALYPVLAKDSGPVDLKIYTGQTAEECVTATSPRVKRTLSLGSRNKMIRQRVRGYAIQHEISQTGSTRWALENLTVEFEQGGQPRKEVVRNTSG